MKFTIRWGGKQIRKSPSISTKAGWGSRACALCSQDFKHTRFSPHHFCIIQWNLTNKRLSEVRWHLIWVVGNQWKRVSWREGNLSWADNLRWMCWGYLQCQFSQRWTPFLLLEAQINRDLRDNAVFNGFSPLLGSHISSHRKRAWEEKEGEKRKWQKGKERQCNGKSA